LINLSEYLDLKLAVSQKIQSLEELKSMTELSSRVLTGMPRGGKHRDLADAIAKLIDLQESFAKEIERLGRALVEIEQTIESVTDPHCKRILYARYILGYSFERIAEDMNYSYGHVIRLHKRGKWLCRYRNAATPMEQGSSQ